MMKTMIRIGLAFFALTLVCTREVDARGGGGGRSMGGGGGRSMGGGGFSGGGMSRSPSMSRPSPSMSRPSPSISRPSPSIASRPSTGAIGGTRPGTGNISGSRPGTGAVAGSRPSAGQLNDFLDMRPSAGAGRPSTLPANSLGNVAGGGGAAADFLRGSGTRPSTLPASGTRPGAGTGLADRPIANRPGIDNRPIADRPGLENRPIADRSMTDNRAGRIENRQQYQDNRIDRRDEVRDQVRDNYPRLDFWSNYPGWAAWRINRPYRWATWGALTGWCGAYGWSEPTPYSYGEDVYYQDDSVYYGDQPVASAEEYAVQAETIIESAPEVSPEQAEWMPLGVFAVTQDGQKSGPDPTLFLQLAISKEGVIAGTLRNTATESTQEIEGVADKESQRAAWVVKGKNRPIMETGIANLTEDTAPSLIHFDDGETQQWLLVRLEEPTAQPE